MSTHQPMDLATAAHARMGCALWLIDQALASGRTVIALTDALLDVRSQLTAPVSAESPAPRAAVCRRCTDELGVAVPESQCRCWQHLVPRRGGEGQ